MTTQEAWSGAILTRLFSYVFKGRKLLMLGAKIPINFESLKADRMSGMTLAELSVKYSRSQSQLSRLLCSMDIEKPKIAHPLYTTDLLRRLKAGESKRQLAKEAGVTIGTMISWIASLRSPRRNRYNPKTTAANIDLYDNHAWFYQKYVVEQWGMSKIAKFLGRSVGLVASRLKRYGIEIRDFQTSMALLSKAPPPEWLTEHYIEQKWSVSKCAEAWGCGWEPMYQALVNAGIVVRDASEQHQGELNEFHGKQHTEETKELCRQLGVAGGEYWTTGDVDAKLLLAKEQALVTWSDAERRMRASRSTAELCKQGKCNPKSISFVTRTGQKLSLHSSWEAKVAAALDGSEAVRDWAYQEVAIKYWDDGIEKLFVVDFRITWADGKSTLLETKNRHLLSKPKEQAKIKALLEHSNNASIDCLVISSSEQLSDWIAYVSLH